MSDRDRELLLEWERYLDITPHQFTARGALIDSFLASRPPPHARGGVTGMKREDVVKGLEDAMMYLIASGRPANDSMVICLRAALALLTPPKQEEIEAARQPYVEAAAEAEKPAYEHAEAIQESADHARLMLKALDALAREPGMEADVKSASIAVEKLMDRIAALEAQLARVREVRMSLINPEDVNESEYFVRVRVGKALDAALAVPTKEG